MLTPGNSFAQTQAEFLSLPIAHVLRSRLSEPWRHYHTWEHPAAMNRHFIAAESEGVPIHDPIACIGFSGYHDAVYDPEAPHGRNEILSALLCETEFTAIAPQNSVIAAAAGTKATIKHLLPDLTICPDGAIMLDVDLSILGADRPTFLFYEKAIRAEYQHVEWIDYVAGRTAVLTRFLERDRLYLTDWGYHRWEAMARTNLEMSIKTLSASI